MTKNNNQSQSTDMKVFHPVVITMVLLILFIAGNSFGQTKLASADNAPTVTASAPLLVPTGTSKEIDAQVANACVTELTKFGDTEFDNYQEFMEENFKNKSNTTSLLGLGMQRYELFKTNISNKYQSLVQQQLDLAALTDSGSTDQVVGLNSCNTLALQYISDAGKVLQMRAYTTSGIKKTSIFVEKYKQINTKLRALDLQILQMTANLSTFQQKLPCYLKTCI